MSSLKISPFNGLKCLIYSNKIEDILKDRIPYPVTVEIDASNMCNHNCKWCMYKDFKKENQVMIPPKRLKDLCFELLDSGIKSVTFTGGGEPLTNPFVPEAMQILHSNGIKVGLVTNGGLLYKKEIQDSIIRNCRFLRVSLDAGSNTTHQKLHGTKNPDEYARILNSLKEINQKRDKEKLEIGIGFLVHPENYTEIEQAAIDVKESGADYIQIRPVLSSDKLSYEIVGYVENTLEKLKGLEDDNFKIYGILHRFDEILFKDHGFKKCRATPLVGVIGADQKLYLCCQWRGKKEAIIGDISNKPFYKVWGREQHEKVLENIDLNKCVPCRYKIYNQAIEQAFVQDKMHKEFL